MKFLGAFLIAAVLALATPALAQNPQTVKLCIPTSGTACANVTATNPLPVTGSFSATLAGFTPNGNYATLTATASSSASTALPAGTVVAFQNLSAIDVSCVLATGSATATTNKLIVRAGATVYYTVGSNVNTACINQTGSASNVIGLAGGAGLGTAFGGASAGGGGGGAVTLAAGAVAAGAYVSGSVLAGAYASGAFAAGAMVDLLTMRGTVGAGTGAANSLLTGCIYNSTPITLSNGQGAAVQCNASGYPTVVVSNTLAAVTPGDGITTTVYGTAPASPVIGAPLLWNGTTYDRTRSGTTTGSVLINGAGTAGTAAGGVVTVQGVASMTPFLSNPGTAANWGIGATAASVPANAVYNGFNSGGNLVGVSASNPLPNSTQAATTGGATTFKLIAAATNNSTLISAGAHTVYSYQTGSISSSTPYWLKFYDKATAPTCGTDTPVKVILIPPTNSGNNGNVPVGFAVTLGLGICVVGGIADNDNTSAAATTLAINVDYK